MENVEILERRRVFDDIFQVEEALVRFRKHDGSWSEPVRRLSFERGDSVAALLVRRDTGRLVLVNQFRYPTCEKGPGRITEIVAGALGDGETPEAAITREIREETGYEVEELAPVTTFYVSPGGTSERIFLFHAVVSGEGRVTESGGGGVGDEDIRVIEVAPSDLWEQFRAGGLQDGKTIVALLWYRLAEEERSARRSTQSHQPCQNQPRRRGS
jgi:ADP-ribose pyrophosphatase